jgi:hypothetical protein
MNTVTKTTKVTTAKRIAATLGSALALNAALVANPASAAVEPNPVTTTTTMVTNPGVSNDAYAYHPKTSDSLIVGKHTQGLVLESQWCKSWGEGQYRIRDFRLNSVVAPEERNRPDAEGSFGVVSHQVAQARAVYCGRNAEGLTEYPVSAAGLRIDIAIPRYRKGVPWAMRTMRNVAPNWSADTLLFEGAILRQLKSLAPGNYTMTAVSTQFPANSVNLTYSVAAPPR